MRCFLKDCQELQKVAIHKGVKRIGQEAFFDCKQLSEIHIPESLAEIGEGAFMHTALTRLTIPDSVTSIEPNAFWDCRIERITVPAHASIGYDAFNENTKVKRRTENQV